MLEGPVGLANATDLAQLFEAYISLDLPKESSFRLGMLALCSDSIEVI